VSGSDVRSWRREGEVSATWKIKTAEKWRHRGRHRELRLHRRNRWMVLKIRCGCASRVKEEVSVCTEQVGRTPRTTTQNQVVIALSMGTYINQTIIISYKLNRSPSPVYEIPPQVRLIYFAFFFQFRGTRVRLLHITIIRGQNLLTLFYNDCNPSPFRTFYSATPYRNYPWRLRIAKST
jgi:hypothetical protein